MADLEPIIKSIVDKFTELAKEEGKKGKLNKDTLKGYLESEFGNDKITEADITESLESLDKDNDGEIKFREFCRCLMALAKCYYTAGKGGKKGKGKGKGGDDE